MSVSSLSVSPTIGEIARRHDQPVHRVRYIIHSRQIVPVSRAGNARVFSEADADFIGAELRKIDAKGVAR